MGHQRFYSRALFIAVWALLPTLVSIGSFVSPTGSMPEMREIPEKITEPILYITPREIVVNACDTFSIRVVALQITDMYCWQVKLNFEPEIVECINVSVPDQHVFVDNYPVSQALIDYNSTEFTKRPMQYIKDDEGYMTAGDSLLGQDQKTFNGSGFLCQIDFKAISSGYSKLELSHYGTFLLDSALDCTELTLLNSTIIVHSTESPSILVASICIGACLGISLLPVKRKKNVVAELPAR